MINTYEEYLDMPRALAIEEMRDLHEEMLSEVKAVNDTDVVEIYEDLLKQAADYCSYRSNWFHWDRAKKTEKDPSRTSSHDSVITHVNMLERILKQDGQPAKWRETLGFEEDNPNNRKRIGDFACYLVFVDSLNAR